MRLFDIIKDYPTKESIDQNLQISNVCHTIKNCDENSLFFCLNGENDNAVDLINQAINKGASAVVCERRLEDINVLQIIVENVRQAYSVFSANFYDNPQKDLKIIGVVGTNGKTSTCHILKHILTCAGKNVAVIGTLGVFYKDFVEDSELTTPDPQSLFETLKKLKERGAEYVVMEVSAHAIYFEKVYAIKFESLIFTNCTQDHLDFFKTFENYKQVKKSIFNEKHAKFLIVNSDDETGRELLKMNNVFSYAINNPSDVFAINVKESVKGIRYVINLFDNIYEISCKLLGLYNVYNTLCAATCAKLLGVRMDIIASALSSITPIKGRMEKVATYNGASIFVDYAHTPDGLEKSLLSLRNITKGNLVCLFGCGGNRDKTKRPIMGRIAGDLADFVVVTSDNPRFEDPMDIIRQVEIGVRESSLDYITICKREKAIKYAIKTLEKGDCLIIAGKGAEEYQEISGVRHFFSDKDVVLELIKDD